MDIRSGNPGIVPIDVEVWITSMQVMTRSSSVASHWTTWSSRPVKAALRLEDKMAIRSTDGDRRPRRPGSAPNQELMDADRSELPRASAASASARAARRKCTGLVRAPARRWHRLPERHVRDLPLRELAGGTVDNLFPRICPRDRDPARLCSRSSLTWRPQLRRDGVHELAHQVGRRLAGGRDLAARL